MQKRMSLEEKSRSACRISSAVLSLSGSQVSMSLFTVSLVHCHPKNAVMRMMTTRRAILLRMTNVLNALRNRSMVPVCLLACMAWHR